MTNVTKVAAAEPQVSKVCHQGGAVGTPESPWDWLKLVSCMDHFLF